MDVAFGGRGKLDNAIIATPPARCRVAFLLARLLVSMKDDVPAGRCPTTLDHLWVITLFSFLLSSFFLGDFLLWRAVDPDRSMGDSRSSAL